MCDGKGRKIKIGCDTMIFDFFIMMRGRVSFMRCPYCGKEGNRVIDSRPVEENNSVRRRRVCDACGRRFTTYEKVEMIPLIVIKKDNNREQYDRSKIEGGILKACHKRPVSMGQIKKAVDEIEGEIFDREEKEISSREIGEMVMEKLHDLDPVAYVRFASVYREFKDVETFMDELEKILKTENAKNALGASKDKKSDSSDQ